MGNYKEQNMQMMSLQIKIYIDKSLNSSSFIQSYLIPTFKETINYLFDDEIQGDVVDREEDGLLTLCDAMSSVEYKLALPISIDNKIGEKYSNINSFQLPKETDLGNCEERKQLALNLTFAILSRLGIGSFHSRIFISYKRRETEQLALELYKCLTAEKLGFEVFLDTRKLDVGAKFMDDIRLSIAESDIFLLLDSAGYWEQDSIYTRKELYTAMYSNTGIIRLFHGEGGQSEITKAFESLQLKKDNCVCNDEIGNLIKIINDKRTSFLKAKMERLNDIRRKIKEKDLWSYKSDTEGVICPIFGIPTSQRIEKLEDRLKDRDVSNPSFSILYDHWIVPETYNNHIQWIVNEKNIKITTLQNMKMPKGNFEKPIVFLSASLSSEKDYDFTKVHNVVVTLVEEVINRSGILVFGGHPTITPIIANMMNIYNATNKVFPNIYLYQSKYFTEEEQPKENKEFPDDKIKRIDACDGNKEESLKVMREKMLSEHGNFTLGVFIGGRVKEDGTCGVWDECKMFHEKNPKAKCISFTNTGTNINVITKYYNPSLVHLASTDQIHNYFN